MLGLRVFLSPYKPFNGASKSWDPSEQPTWPASTVTLIEGDHDAVLVDGLMTLAEGAEVLAWIHGTGKQVIAAYVTHGHADHVFGLEPVLTAFPDAQLVTLAEIAPAVAGQTDEKLLALWNSYFPGQLSAHPRLPVAMSGDRLELEGQVIECVLLGPSDVEVSSVVHVPELAAVVAGDVAYNRVHMWLAGSDPKTRAAWIDSLDAIEELHPQTVIAGHKDPGTPDDDAARILDESRRYIRDFDDVVAGSESAREVVAKMLAKYPTWGNPYTLTYAADTQRP